MKMKLVIGADPFGAELKEVVREHLEKNGHEVIDVGTTASEEVTYYDVAVRAAKKIQAGDVQQGVLFCGTGMGVAVVANKFKGIVASCVETPYAAKMCKAINNANVLTMGGMMVAPHQATLAVDEWMNTEHTQGLEEYADFLKKSTSEVDKIEKENMK
jgi:ribose 5-phosphate isomerase B